MKKSVTSVTLSTLSKNVDSKEKYVADLEHALDVVGFGVYNGKYCFVLTLFITGAIVELVGYAYVMPSSVCDLQMSNSVRGLVSSVPYICVVITSFPWGYLVDTRGRKPILMIASLGGGSFSMAAMFMPELISFVICKAIGSLCLSCLVATPYSYIGEIVPKKYRDVILSIGNSMQIIGVVVLPLYAWAVLPLDFRVNIGAYDFRPWRLLGVLYSLHFILPAVLLLPGPESPKYLVSQGRHDEAMAVLRVMYAGNKGKAPEDFPIKALKMPEDNHRNKGNFLSSLKQQSVPLLKLKYLKWLLLNGFLLFGIFNVLNGLAAWIPDVTDKVLSGNTDGLTACQIITQKLISKHSDVTTCDDTLDTNTFVVTAVSIVICAFIAFLASASVKFLGKKTLLTSTLLANGLFCTAINWTTQPMVIAVLLAATTLSNTGIGPTNAYGVELFPTHLRGMAIGISMMIGRIGSILGANLPGNMIPGSCEAMFYLFGGILILGSILSCLLPSSRRSPTNNKPEDITRM